MGSAQPPLRGRGLTLQRTAAEVRDPGFEVSLAGGGVETMERRGNRSSRRPLAIPGMLAGGGSDPGGIMGMKGNGAAFTEVGTSRGDSVENRLLV